MALAICYLEVFFGISKFISLFGLKKTSVFRALIYVNAF